MPELIYTKYSNDRDEKFNIVTDIMKDDDDTKFVFKHPFNDKADSHIKTFLKNSKILSEKYKNTDIEILRAENKNDGAKIPFAEGEAFSIYLDKLLFAEKRTEWKNAVNEYFSNMFIDKKRDFERTEGFNKIFGDIKIGNDEPSVADIDIDMLFSNVFYNGDKWKLYDYEWTVNFDVPVNYLVYRCIHYYFETQTRAEYFTNEIYNEFGIPFSQIKIFENMEKNFQNYVKGSGIPLWEMYHYIRGDNINVSGFYNKHKERMTADYSKAQMYYDYGSGFYEKDSVDITKYINTNNELKIHADLDYDVTHLRIDPCAGPCLIRNVEIKADGRLIANSSNGYKIDKNEYIFTNNDPQILIDVTGYKTVDISFTLLPFNELDAQSFIDLQSYIEGQLEKISETEKEMVLRENEYQIELAKKQKALIEAHQSIHEYAQSLSWKITKPLRSVKGKISKLRRKESDISDIKEETAETQPLEEEFSDESVENENYQTWIKSVEESDEKININELKYKPKISVLVPVYNVSEKQLTECIESVINQDYPNWELCIADDCSTWDSVKETLKKYENNEKIKIVYRSENGHISECTNSALKIATGEFVALLDCDDVLAPNALSEVAALLNENRNLDFIYSDEDKIDEEGKIRHNPHFKQDWAPDTFMAIMYTCHLAVYRRSLALEIGGFRKGYEGAQDYDFTLRFTEKTNNVGHIPKILYHWRERRESTASDMSTKPYALKAAAKSKEDALLRRGLHGNLEYIPECAQYRVNYIPDKYPKISVIIPSKDNFEYLERCLRTFSEKTDYPDYELIVIDNGSNEDNKKEYESLIKEYNALYIYEERDFNFSAMCNRGAEFASGELLLFLNDDTEIISDDWLKRMAGQALLKHTGAVGAKLLYPGGNLIQHVGVVGTLNGPIHAFGNLSDDMICYYGRNILTYNYIAVTAACVMIDKNKFYEVGGFDENLKVAFNDIDFCFKLAEKGYYNVVRNDAVLIHHESVSRGYDKLDESKQRRMYKEKRMLYNKHPQFRIKDPFYNPNLTQTANDFTFNYNRAAYMAFSKPEKTSDYKVNPDSVLYNIDEAYAGYDEILIRGWIVISERNMSELPDMQILLKNDKNVYFKADASRVRRADVDKSLEGSGKYKQSGFICQIKNEDLPKGKYRLGIKMGDKGIMTENYLTVS